jgi:putative restriction endonuclease
VLLCCVRYGDDIPLVGGLDAGFSFRGTRVPFFNRMKGIHRARVQRGPAALSLQTSAKSPYGDEETDAGFVYAYRDGPIDQPDNRALRAAWTLQVPVAYFVATRPGWYRPICPMYVTEDDPAARTVLLTPGAMVGSMDDPAPTPIANEVERRYAVRETKVRLHQARFRGLVLPAYHDRCAICRLREIRLLDAAHIASDATTAGQASVNNGLSLCTIHHRAFDEGLVGVAPDYRVHVAHRLLDDEDGPMLDLLKQFHGALIELPTRPSQRPSPARLAERFERFATT